MDWIWLWFWKPFGELLASLAAIVGIALLAGIVFLTLCAIAEARKQWKKLQDWRASRSQEPQP